MLQVEGISEAQEAGCSLSRMLTIFNQWNYRSLESPSMQRTRPQGTALPSAVDLIFESVIQLTQETARRLRLGALIKYHQATNTKA